MFKTPEQFATANKAAVDSLLTIANTTLETTERLAALNLGTARAFLADGAASIETLLTVKDPQALLAWQIAVGKPALEKSVAYSRTVYEILNESAKGLSHIVDGHTVELKKSFSAAVDQSLKNAPAGSEPVVAAVKSALAAADSAYETMTKAAKQATAAIEANVATANAAASKLIAKAA